MRVIAGNFKGRKLKSVPGNQTRPTADKIKEAVFHIMGPYFDGGMCLDLFAGSGSLGIEAISRGFDFVVFNDKNRKAVHTIMENIGLLNIEDKTEVLRIDAFQALRVIAKNNTKFDLILIDPPYGQVKYTKLLETIIKLNLLSDSGLIYCEHSTSEDLPVDFTEIGVMKQLDYGRTTAVTIYQKITSNYR